MNVKQMAWRLLVVVVLVGLLVGCSSPTATEVPTKAPTVPPTLAPTVDLQPTYNAIKTQSAATVVSNLTQNAPSASATSAASVTATKPAQPQPTATIAATSTSQPKATATTPAILTPWTLVPTKAAYNCTVTDYSPKTNVTYPPSSNFDVHWVVKNTGTQKWLATETIFRYSDGEKMQKKADYVFLGTDVAPDGSYDVGIDMVAPATAGTYRTTWRLTYGNVTICSMAIAVVIK